MPLIVETFPCREDNYGYLAHDAASGRTAAIDAPEAAPIEAALARRGWTLTDILITHHHADHTDGIVALKSAHGATVTAPAAEADKIPAVDRTVSAGDTVTLGETSFAVLAAPGHTLGHIVYYDAVSGSLFSGDALFSLGVGRMFEGTPEPMWAGLRALRELPDQTLVYCGHEYTAANARFALSVDPDNEALKARAADVSALRATGEPTIPAILGAEKATNPFLRADQPALRTAMGLPDAPAFEVFAALRRSKDNFR